MGMKKDMSVVLKERADARASELTDMKHQIEAGVERPGRGRPIENPSDPKKGVTINLKSSSHRKIKIWAAMQGTTVSSLIEDWIDEHCTVEL